MPSNISPLSQLTQLLSNDLAIFNHVLFDSIKSDVSLVSKVGEHILSSGGKRIRPLLTLACHQLCQNLSSTAEHISIYHTESIQYKNTGEHHRLATAVELIHTATLLHDDVIDLSDQRRGRPTAHTLFGNTAAILVGDYLFSRSFQLMVSCSTPGVLDILSGTAALITEGEVMQLSQSYQTDLTIEQYLEILSRKTASLFETACVVGGMVGCRGMHDHALLLKALKNYGKFLGITFQILDDIFDYFPPENFGKNPGDDFEEGKITLPIILALKQLDGTADAQWIREIFESKTKTGAKDDAMFARLQNLCLTHSIYEQSMAFAISYAEKARDALSSFPETSIKSILQDLPLSLTRQSFMKPA